jgi:hypothetical protein
VPFLPEIGIQVTYVINLDDLNSGLILCMKTNLFFDSSWKENHILIPVRHTALAEPEIFIVHLPLVRPILLKLYN